MNKERLLNVARALRESPKPSDFRMSAYLNDCGTPACAIGHYAARTDLQDICRIVGNVIVYDDMGADGMYFDYDDSRALDHFGISEEEADLLFGPHGCDDAKTAIEAAEYIERFVAEHSKADAS